MIKYNNKNIIAMYINGHRVVFVYTLGLIVWELEKNNTDEILSCYHNGYWIDEYPWTDDTSWAD